MENTISDFIIYMEQVKKASGSTVVSYQRDLKKLFAFLQAKGIKHLADITSATLNSYVFFSGKRRVFNCDNIEKHCIHEGVFPLCIQSS